MLQMNLRYGREEAVRSVLITSARSAGGQDHDRVEPRVRRGLGRTVGRARRGRPAPDVPRRALRPAPRPGLAELLEGEWTSRRRCSASRCCRPRNARNGSQRAFDVIVGGSPSSDPWALLQSDAHRRSCWSVLKQRHDLVVIDTPPIAHVSDAISLLQRRRRRPPRGLGQLHPRPGGPPAARPARRAGGHILGVVANGGTATAGYGYAAPRNEPEPASPPSRPSVCQPPRAAPRPAGTPSRRPSARGGWRLT